MGLAVCRSVKVEIGEFKAGGFLWRKWHRGKQVIADRKPEVAQQQGQVQGQEEKGKCAFLLAIPRLVSYVLFSTKPGSAARVNIYPIQKSPQLAFLDPPLRCVFCQRRSHS